MGSNNDKRERAGRVSSPVAFLSRSPGPLAPFLTGDARILPFQRVPADRTDLEHDEARRVSGSEAAPQASAGTPFFMNDPAKARLIDLARLHGAGSVEIWHALFGGES